MAAARSRIAPMPLVGTTIAVCPAGETDVPGIRAPLSDMAGKRPAALTDRGRATPPRDPGRGRPHCGPAPPLSLSMMTMLVLVSQIRGRQ